jgi:Tfp pilus assembly protein PilZ
MSDGHLRLKRARSAVESGSGGTAMRTHVEPRFRKRLPCQVKIDGSEHEGWIVNLSRSGLFVQTAAGVGPGQMVEVALQAPTASPELVLRSRVVWRRSVPPQLRQLMGGIGVQIHHAPESYYSLVDAVERLQTQVPRAIDARRARPIEPEPEIARMRFRIQLERIGTRTRTLEVDAESEADARRAARNLAGTEWTVARVDPLDEE